jgi:phosphoadenosine phosphosulfate reductase
MIQTQVNTSSKAVSNYSVDMLNDMFKTLHIRERIRLLYELYDERDILFTSSFGTKSAYLLYLISEIRPSQTVYFIDTAYHFPETIQYKKQLAESFGLKVVDVLPDIEKHMLTREGEWWKDHPRMCCTINKIAPVEPLIASHKVWIAGLMAFQTKFRSRLEVFVEQGDIIKFHPLVDIDEGEFLYRMGYHNIPRHPLESEGYGSIGCTHCTSAGEGRDGRWQGTGKTECGLHPSYFVQKQKGETRS